MLEINEVSYEGYDAYQLKNEKLSLIVLPAVGGRIVSYETLGAELLYTVPELNGRDYELEGIVDIEAYRNELNYVPAGGYKTWLAPQMNWGWPPYLDLAIGDYDVNYEVSEEKIEFELTSPICRETGMRLTRKLILLDGENEIIIQQGMQNYSSKTKEYGLWDVTQLKSKGQVIFPIQSSDDIMAVYDSEISSQVNFKRINNQLFAVVECQGQKEFKVGTYFSAGWVLSLIDKDGQKLGYLKKFPIFNDPEFGHDCAIEVFDTYKYDYFEVEVHGPMIDLKEGDRTSFIEEWECYSWELDTSLEEVLADLSLL